MSDRFFPLRAAGFATNPFRALTDSEWAEIAVLSPAVLDAFDRSDAHVQIRGGLGAGKTTTLFGLQALAHDRRQRVAYEYVADGQDRFTTEAGSLDLFLLDEAQRLSGRELNRLLDLARRAHSPGPRIVLASHADLTARFEAAGLPLADVDVDDLTTTQYRVILDWRLEHAALPDRSHATLADDVAPYVLATFGTNRRGAEWLLYEAFQSLRTPDQIDAARLEAVRVSLSGPGAVASRTAADESDRGPSGRPR